MSHENYSGNLLDQRSIDGVNIRQLLFWFFFSDCVVRHNRLSARVAEKYCRKIRKKGFRLRRAHDVRLVPAHGQHWLLYRC